MSMSLEKAIKKLLIMDPFYGLFLLSINKRFDNKIPTACVCRNGIDVELLINKNFWESLSDDEELAIFQHEVLHLCHGHLTMQQNFPNKKHFNIASDANINCYIKNLPEGAILPENYGLPGMCGTKFYYENIPEDADDNTLDIHDWKDFENLTEVEKKLIQNQIDHLAKRAAEQTQKMQGTIPAGLQDYIKELFKQKKRIFNWKSYFRRMLGSAQDVERKKTRKKESERFPGASGLKHKRKSNVCVVVDTSGSVSNQELVDFFSEIKYVWKAGTNVTIIENDAAIGRIYDYKGTWDGNVTGRGGTVFNQAVDWFNEHRKDYQCVVFFTDGYADVDLNIKGQSIWVITSNGNRQKYPGYTLYIPKNE